MYLIYQDKISKGKIDNQSLPEKPQFSFSYEYLCVKDNIAEYAPRDRANYQNIEPTKEEITEFYENRPLSESQLQEVMDFYNSYPREPDIKPTYDRATEKLVEDGIEVIDGLTYKKYVVQPKSQAELDEYLEQLKPLKVEEIKSNYAVLAKQPVTDSILGVTWNGGEASASAINGAVSLAEAAGEIDVTLWDINNDNHTSIDFTTARQIAAEIALTYRQIMYERNGKISQVRQAVTIEEVSAI